MQRTFDAEPVPLELMFLVDHSLSMEGPKWESVTQAVQAFADTASVSALSIGLQLFPDDGVVDPCLVSSYGYPLVPLQATPQVAAPIKKALDRYGPTALTSPARPALEGTLQFLRQRAKADRFAQRAVVLVTDGLTNNCDSSIASVAGAAAAARDAEPEVLTFVVGMEGAALDSLDEVALAGGTERAFVVNAEDPSGEGLEGVLKSTRELASSCDFVLPTAEQGRLVPSSVQVSFRSSQDADVVRWPLLDRKERCAGENLGAYYDDPRSPERLTLCPAACKRVRAARDQGVVRIEAACVIVLV